VTEASTVTARETKIARVLRPLGSAPMTRAQARTAAHLLGVHWTSVYRLRRRFLADPVASSLVPRKDGRKNDPQRLPGSVESIVQDVIETWVPKQRELAHPALDVHVEIRRRCLKAGLKAPSRSTVSRRLSAHRELKLLAASQDPSAAIAPGSFGAAHPLDVVQIDHTQADVFVVDRFSRRTIGRPWLSVAIDLATRCVVAFFVGMERPNAATVAILVSRIVLPKRDWLASLELEFAWPMNGLPKMLHMDNAAEFHSRALRTGCGQYGIEMEYRPVGQPHFGGHIERMNRTLMQRLKGLPGATGNSPKGRKARRSEESACLTLKEFERWLALEVGQRYHLSGHRGLFGATPQATWLTLVAAAPPRQLPATPDASMRMLIEFMPMDFRSIQADGLTIFHIRYWHPVFLVWQEDRRRVRLRYHPEDLSRVFVSADGRNYVEARYADLRRPSITLWEQRAAVRLLRTQGHPRLSEALMFRAIEQQRDIVDRARRETRSIKSSKRRPPPRSASTAKVGDVTPVDYGRNVPAYPLEIW
jgi:putative transposase